MTAIETKEPWDPIDQATDKAVIAGRITPNHAGDLRDRRR